jgi:uncharacterized membrane protein YoaK (UPF0700 family)
MSSKLEFFVVLIGGLGLAFIAGYVNTLVIVLGAPPVTHLTGSISRLSADLSSNDYSDALSIGLIVLSFVVGAMIAGIIIGSSTLRLGRRYGVAIMLESALLALAAWTIPMSLVGGLLFAAAAAGLQNAMAASYRSLIIRTTHLTGVLTDIGFELGRIVSGKKRPDWQVLLLSCIVVAFTSGGIIGAIVGESQGSTGLWYPVSRVAARVRRACVLPDQTHAQDPLITPSTRTPPSPVPPPSR